MLAILQLLLAVVLGLVIGWLIASSRLRKTFSESMLRTEVSLKVAESQLANTRQSVVELKTENDLRGKAYLNFQQQIKDEAEQKAAAVAELRDARLLLEELATIRQQLQIEEQHRVVAETKLAESQAGLEAQKALLVDAKASLSDAFGALSAQALKSNSSAFLELAANTFKAVQAESVGSLNARQQAIDGLVAPLRESLERYEKQIQEMEKSRQQAYGSLDEQLRTLTISHQQLGKETGSLVTALRTPQVRGRWGEMTLRRTAELAGMVQHCDFSEQETLESEGNRQRPDMVVNLPGDRRIVVDAKVPLQAFLDAISAPTEGQRAVEFAKHGQLVRNHMNQLAARNYWEQFTKAPEIVVLFLPGESFFAAAAEQDRTLIEDGMEKRVILATPTTLIALLRAVAYGWRQEDIAKSAQEISDLGKQLHDRVRTFVGHFQGMGTALTRVVNSFNEARASLESRVLPGARRFRDLKAATGEEIEAINPIDSLPAALSPSEPT
jgi:DNA recombination protein RmuC